MGSRFAAAPAQQGHGRLPETMTDRLEIRELLENWVVWRDAGDWDRFATVWHDDGRMNATWFQASAAQFIEGCRKAFESGMVGQHFLGGATIDVLGCRAIAQTKMQIIHRGRIDDVPVDVTCQGRFLDALERRAGRWGLVFRQPVYELDRIAPVDSSTLLNLDQELLLSFPEGYCHLAYLQTQMGFEINKSLPGTRGPEIEALNASMGRWLHGDDQAFL